MREGEGVEDGGGGGVGDGRWCMRDVCMSGVSTMSV